MALFDDLLVAFKDVMRSDPDPARLENPALVLKVWKQIEENKCSYEHCTRSADTMACGRHGGHPKPALYCESHAEEVKEEDSPEYSPCCPNCGCLFGVG